MTKVRLLLKRGRSNPTNDFLFENPDTEEGFMLRAPHARLPEDIEVFPVEITVDASGAAGRFILFLREAVRQAPGGRLSGNMIWAAWAERNGASATLQVIEGIDRKDLHKHFRFAFDEGKMSRLRLDGRVQRVWMDYELASE